MLNGLIDRNCRGYYTIHVNGYPRMLYIGYSKREAIAKYRRDHHLVGRKIDFLDMSKRSVYMENGVLV